MFREDFYYFGSRQRVPDREMELHTFDDIRKEENMGSGTKT